MEGMTAYQAWIAHYNGEGELSNRTALATKTKLENLHYKSKRSMSFERCTEIMKCFNTLHKDPDQRYSDRRRKLKSSSRLYVVPTLNLSRGESLRGKPIRTRLHCWRFLRLLFTASLLLTSEDWNPSEEVLHNGDLSCEFKEMRTIQSLTSEMTR
jgi:hypothetical protein